MQRIEAFTEISAATHNAVELAHALLPYARQYLDAADVADLESVIDASEDDADTLESVLTVVDALNEHAAPFCSIAFHEGDGALLGCWPCVESAWNDEDVLRVADTSDIPADYCGFALHVNDHGNATLYECHGAQGGPECVIVEVWGVI